MRDGEINDLCQKLRRKWPSLKKLRDRLVTRAYYYSSDQLTSKGVQQSDADDISQDVALDLQSKSATLERLVLSENPAAYLNGIVENKRNTYFAKRSGKKEKRATADPKEQGLQTLREVFREATSSQREVSIGTLEQEGFEVADENSLTPLKGLVRRESALKYCEALYVLVSESGDNRLSEIEKKVFLLRLICRLPEREACRLIGLEDSGRRTLNEHTRRVIQAVKTEKGLQEFSYDDKSRPA